MVVPEAIRQAALFPELDLPDLPPEHPTRRVSVAGVFVRLPAGLPVALVSPERLEGSEIDRVVDEVRQFLRNEGCKNGIWIVPEGASPAGLAARLHTLGMTPNNLPGVEAREAMMAAVTAPPPGRRDVLARRAETFEEFRAAQLIAGSSFEMDEKMRQVFEERAELLWSFESSTDQYATYVASLETRSSRSREHISDAQRSTWVVPVLGRISAAEAPTQHSFTPAGRRPSSEEPRLSLSAQERCRAQSSNASASRSSGGPTAYSTKSHRQGSSRLLGFIAGHSRSRARLRW